MSSVLRVSCLMIRSNFSTFGRLEALPASGSDLFLVINMYLSWSVSTCNYMVRISMGSEIRAYLPLTVNEFICSFTTATEFSSSPMRLRKSICSLVTINRLWAREEPLFEDIAIAILRFKKLFGVLFTSRCPLVSGSTVL